MNFSNFSQTRIWQYITLLNLLLSFNYLLAQNKLNELSESLKPNVVAVRASFADDSEEKGFGFITAEQNGHLYLATAAHIVRGPDKDKNAQTIRVKFFNDISWYLASFKYHWDEEDLALLEISKPNSLKWREDCADLEPSIQRKVHFIGLNGQEPNWADPGLDGIIFEQTDKHLNFAISTIRPGTSGAPLITDKGIVGLITQDEGGISTALKLTRIKTLFNGSGQYPYFGLNQPDAYNLVLVKGGTFTMGCTSEQGSDCDDDEKTSHQVTLDDFYIAKYEVTQAQWRSVMGGDPPNLNFKGCDECPVEGVSWENIQDFLKKLNVKTGKKFRLPTEAEWEYAARGGKKSQGYKYVGSNNAYEVLWFDPNSGSKTYPVGSKKANELGLYDMSGNVWEWCQDWYGLYSSNAQMNPTGPNSGSSRVIRGSGWNIDLREYRVSNRDFRTPSDNDGYLGFRLAQ